MRKEQVMHAWAIIMLSKDALIKILSQNNFRKDIKIDDKVLPMIQNYLDIFIEEAALRSLQSQKDASGGHRDGPLELSHLDLERIVGLLLMDM